MAALQDPPAIEPNTRFKYSNLGYGLLGKVIEACAGEPYATWIRREIVDATGLTETEPDMPLTDGIPFARGHSGRLVLGRRLTIPGDFHHQRARARGRLRQHGGRPRPLFRAAVAEGAQERAVGGEPTRDGAQAVARSPFEPRALLRPGHDQR
jgi:CubicO group peptidase (beta-lactamase class C family)